jgi:aminoglycoside/choline kinase family phosphotransferase
MGSPRSETLAYIEHSFPGATLTPLAGDASTRNFYRFIGPDGVARVLMEYDGPFSAPTDDLVLSGVFRAAALPVARVLDSCGSAGCVVLEDLGNISLETALTEVGPSSEVARDLLERVVELAVQIATRGTPALAASERSRGPALDAERFRFEMDFFLEHFAAGWKGCPPATFTVET